MGKRFLRFLASFNLFFTVLLCINGTVTERVERSVDHLNVGVTRQAQTRNPILLRAALNVLAATRLLRVVQSVYVCTYATVVSRADVVQ